MSEGSNATRWVVLVLAMGAAGWAAYTVHERGLLNAPESAPVAPEPARDGRLEALLSEGYAKLSSGDHAAAEAQFAEARKLDAADARAAEALALAKVARAEAAWWKLRLSAAGDAERQAMVETLDHDVDAARHVIADIRLKLDDEALETRLALHEQRLNTMAVVAFEASGDRERAQGALNARLAGSPVFDLLRRYLDAAPAPDGSASAAASTPAPSASAPLPKVRDPWGERHYEFDREPKNVPKVPGELELPAPNPNDLP